MIYKLSLTILSIIFTIIKANAQLPEEKPLYPDGLENNPIKHSREESYVDSMVNPSSLSQQNRVYSYISEPAYMLFPAADSNNKNIGVVIFPGGGLVNNWVDKEGTDLALWLSAKGITCMVVKYRTNERNVNKKYTIPKDTYISAARMDAFKSIEIMKDIFRDSLIFDAKVGILGFSAGGWLTEKVLLESVKGEDYARPDFAALIYHGNSTKVLKKVKKDIHRFPPVFMAMARDDRKLPIGNVISYLTTILIEVEGSELHIYSKGDHGFGLAYDNGHSVELWKESYYRWLLDICNK
ncbi:MAG: dienelactone hydrolase family protein [Bacteroidales bacterium]|nr:dienelactone hydrolase family protein [Bacteroidales bacterium]